MAEETVADHPGPLTVHRVSMSSKTRVLVMSVSVPVIAFAIVGGFLGKVMAREDTYQHLKIFDDVVGLITSSYVEDVNIDRVMRGAMRGLADGSTPIRPTPQPRVSLSYFRDRFVTFATFTSHQVGAIKSDVALALYF